MKRFIGPILLLCLYFYVYISNDLIPYSIWVYIDFLNYLLIPIALYWGAKVAPKTKAYQEVQFSFLVFYLIYQYLIHLGCILTDYNLEFYLYLLLLTSIQSFMFYAWIICLLLYTFYIIKLRFQLTRLSKENILKMGAFYLPAILSLLLYLLDYGFFDPHVDYIGGLHGHPFWIDGWGHLH